MTTKKAATTRKSASGTKKNVKPQRGDIPGALLEIKTHKFLESFLTFDPIKTIPAPEWMKLLHQQYSITNQAEVRYQEFSTKEVNKEIKEHISKMRNNTFAIEPKNSKGVEYDFVVRWRDKYYLIDAKDHKDIGKDLFQLLDGQKNTWNKLREQDAAGSFLLAGPRASKKNNNDFSVESANQETKPITNFVFESLDRYVKSSRAAGLSADQKADLILTKLFRTNAREIEPLNIPCVSMNTTKEPNALALLKVTAEELFPYIDIEEFDYGSLKGYQREIDPVRVKKIAGFLEGGHGFWPNTIVLSCDSEDLEITDDDVTIPGLTNVLKIVDGQHRFFGSLWANNSSNIEMPICIVKTQDEEARAFTFLKINHEAKAVNDSLMMEMYRNEKVVRQLLGSAANRTKEVNQELARHWAARLIYTLNEHCWDRKFAVGKREGLPATNIWKQLIKMLLTKGEKKGPTPRYLTMIQTAIGLNNLKTGYADIENDFKLFFRSASPLFAKGPKLLYPGGIISFLFLYERYFLRDCFQQGAPREKIMKTKLKLCSTKNSWKDFNPEPWRGGPGQRALYQILAKGCNDKSTAVNFLRSGKEPDEKDPKFEDS